MQKSTAFIGSPCIYRNSFCNTVRWQKGSKCADVIYSDAHSLHIGYAGSTLSHWLVLKALAKSSFLILNAVATIVVAVFIIINEWVNY